MNIFTPSPFVSELYAHSCNTRSEAACVLKRKIECASLNMGVLLPLLPFGLSSPTREEFSPPKMRDILFVLLIKFESRIEIIERRTALTERRSRGEEGDSTRTAPVST